MKFVKRVRCLMAACVFIVGGLALPVAAHTALKSSVPAAGATLTALPAHITLQFSAPVRLVSVALFDRNGDRAAMAFTPASAAEAHYRVPTPALNCGDWRLRWVAMGGDGHKMSGEVLFTYACDSADE